MKTPYVNAVGIVDTPDTFESRTRSYPLATRVGAGFVLGTFLFVSLTTSVMTLASYCLTSHAGLPFGFPS